MRGTERRDTGCKSQRRAALVGTPVDNHRMRILRVRIVERAPDCGSVVLVDRRSHGYICHHRGEVEGPGEEILSTRWTLSAHAHFVSSARSESRGHEELVASVGHGYSAGDQGGAGVVVEFDPRIERVYELAW